MEKFTGDEHGIRDLMDALDQRYTKIEDRLIQHDLEWIWCRQNEDGLILFSASTTERDDKINAQQSQQDK
ncbi:hypothetical protein PAAG_07923 [Paracoccidioides lutzii Pb01]|uniref:Uncharacterized protein n=1 Tax=Paracoccidioides lutzii (strain ATCC MYA-826 / Pb01) TaxID=502779 RepID=C1HAU4_PARBA|nr:hypothetical protein PAAG_07923 [Paracoccidioides lutzii Pb01]EEH37505.1 hypothetical protein PAAG_07923 [Paracoccidioides lutzii Pb01]